MMFRLWLSAVIAVLCVSVNHAATNEKEDSIRALIGNMQASSSLHAQERVYLHFDNTSYYVGESIWFKAYVVRAADLQSSDISHTLYVELVGQGGTLVERKILPITDDGTAEGNFKLFEKPNNAGYYEIRAYTRWMRNWDANSVFSRVFPVFNAPHTEDMYGTTMNSTVELGKREVYNHRPVVDYEDDVNITFYPEGGELVAGIANRVAFKIVDANGHSIENIQLGRVRDKSKRIIAELAPRHDGMGMFTFTPQENEEYSADLAYNDKYYSVPLPEALTQGYVLSVDNDRDSLRVRLTKSAALPDDTLGVVISCRGNICNSRVVYLTGSNNSVWSESSLSLPRGVLQVTVLDYLGRILCERMIFNNVDAQKLSEGSSVITTDVEQVRFEPFALSHIVVKVNDENGAPKAGVSLSVSVRDSETNIPSLRCETMEANLLLSSDLAGYIHNPNYYFESNDEAHRKALDLLLLTQGWRRYQWKPQAIRYAAEQGISIDGQVRKLVRRKRPQQNIKLSYVMGGMRADVGYTNANGQFSFTENFYGTERLLLQTTNKRDRKVSSRIMLNRNFMPPSRTLAWREVNADLRFQKDIPTYSDSTYEKDAEGYKILPQATVELSMLDEFAVSGRRSRPLKEMIILNLDELRDQMQDDDIDLYYSDEDLAMFDRYNIGPLLERYDPYYTGSLSEPVAGHTGPVRFYAGAEDPHHPSSSIPSDVKPRGYWHAGKPCYVVRTDEQDIDQFIYSLRTDTVNTLTQPRWRDSKNIRDWDLYGDYNKALAIKQIVLIDLPREEERRRSIGWGMVPPGRSLMVIQYYKNALKRKEGNGVRKATLQGYNVVSKYYHVEYRTPPPEGTVDRRRTLYWNPNLVTDRRGRAHINFYNNSSADTYMMDIKGLSSSGILHYDTILRK